MKLKKEAWEETFDELTEASGDNQPRKLKSKIGRERAEKIEVSVTFTKPQNALNNDINSLEILEEENINDVNNDGIDENAADVTNESNCRKGNPKYIQFANTIKNIGDIDNKGGNITIHFD